MTTKTQTQKSDATSGKSDSNNYIKTLKKSNNTGNDNKINKNPTPNTVPQVS